jgi:Annexin
LLGRSNEQKALINTIYSRDHKKTLDAAIRSETSGDLQRFLIALSGVCISIWNEGEGEGRERRGKGVKRNIFHK